MKSKVRRKSQVCFEKNSFVRNGVEENLKVMKQKSEVGLSLEDIHILESDVSNVSESYPSNQELMKSIESTKVNGTVESSNKGLLNGMDGRNVSKSNPSNQDLMVSSRSIKVESNKKGMLNGMKFISQKVSTVNLKSEGTSPTKSGEEIINDVNLSNTGSTEENKLGMIRMVKGEKEWTNQTCQGCGNKLETRGLVQELDKVRLFEHVYASGVPNYQCCRISVCQPTMNIALWRDRLSGYRDSTVCDLLQFGFPLDFDKKKSVCSSVGRNHKGARDFPQFIKKYFVKECAANRMAGPFLKNPLSVDLVVSPMNTVPKDSADERRVIVDLSWPHGASVNDGISKDVYLGEDIDLHYASVEQVCAMINEIGPGAVIYKRDLRHAYRQVAVDPFDYQFLGYFWENEYYFDTVLAMGQRNAAMACTRTTNAVMHMHAQDGYRGVNYLDDLIGVSTPDKGQDAYNSLGHLLSDLGLFENFDKACPPATIQMVLGIMVNTVDGTLSVPEERMDEILTLVSMWQDKLRSTKVELQSLIGKLQYVSKCVLSSKVFMNRLLETLRSIKDQKSICLSNSFRKDLKWWSMFMDTYNGVSFIPASIWAEPDVTFATDSCLLGCGGVCLDEYFHTDFPVGVVDQGLPIHCKEMLAVLVAVRLWGSRLRGLKIQIYCDNEPAVKVINSGRTKDKFLGSCIRELWLEVSKYNFQLRAVHLPGEENRVPDWLSRWNCGQKYRDLFNNFIADEHDRYKEINIQPNLFTFSGVL